MESRKSILSRQRKRAISQLMQSLDRLLPSTPSGKNRTQLDILEQAIYCFQYKNRG